MFLGHKFGGARRDRRLDMATRHDARVSRPGADKGSREIPRGIKRHNLRKILVLKHKEGKSINYRRINRQKG